ncbi:MAG TPA: hypothetical protein VJA21_13265 [Verrucomicrobiae bacterium]
MKKQLLWIVMAVASLILGRELASAQLTMQEAASQGLLRPLRPIEIPTSATFWSWQTSCPLPYDPCPDCTAYALPDGTGVLVDDREVLYPVFGRPAGSQLSGNGLLDNPPPDYGCGLWLELHIVASVAQVTLNNVVPGRTYNLWSSSDLTVPVASWAFETTRTASSSDPIVIPVQLQGRPPTLFFRASEVRDYAIQTRFDGVSATNVPGMACPDSMGAVGTDRFVELINGMIQVYTKGGILVTQDITDSFFHIRQGSTDYPTSGATDSRIFYDVSVTPHRWVACSVDENGSQYVLLAVSTGSSPDDLTDGWLRYLVPVGGALSAAGMDAYGIYLDRVTYLGTNQPSHAILAIRKSDLYSRTLTYNSVLIPSDPTVPVHYLQPACNFDSLGPAGYTFLLAKGAPSSGTPYRGAAIFYHRLYWDGSAARLPQNEAWIQLTSGPREYRNYYDLTDSPVSAPHYIPGGIGTMDVRAVGSDLMPRAGIKNGVLCFCHLVGLSGPSGTYTGDATGAAVDRSGVQWFRASADTVHGSLAYLEHGRIYDTAVASPLWYHFPSIAVNCAGDIVAGFSASNANSYVGAYYSWRPIGGLPSAYRLIRNGLGAYEDSRWGDYSVVVTDPTDNWSFWTVQEYADYPNPLNPNSWRTVIAQVRAQP